MSLLASTPGRAVSSALAWTLSLAALAVGACTPKPASPPKEAARPVTTGGAVAVIGGRLSLSDGTLAPRTLHLSAGTIRAIDEEGPAPGESTIDASGLTLLPAFIDSHVHITFSAPEFELQGGIAAALDLGAPPSIWSDAPKMAPFRLYPSGQLITAPDGYPTRGWGRDGYGREVSGPQQAALAAREFIDQGAKLVKMPLEPNGGPLLSAEEQRALVEAAHQRGVVVGSHAMSAETVKMALAAGVDVLVHAPLGRLDEETIRAFCGRPRAAVISTFEAFALGGSAQDNVRRMKGAGCTILYGSDLGNGVSAGILPAELADLVGAGLSPREAIESATKVPAAYFGLSDLGELAPGKAASLIGVEGDPFRDISAMESLRLVVIEGAKVSP
jgi:imidazolonepropionase-like amidohydrolase